MMRKARVILGREAVLVFDVIGENGAAREI